MPAARVHAAGIVVQSELQGWKSRSNCATLLQAWYMVGRGRHQHNEINATIKAIRKISTAFSVVEDHNGHRWGWIICICGTSPFCVNSTPRNPGGHAKQIRKWALTHSGCGSNDKEETS
jgi:hypothetical protein